MDVTLHEYHKKWGCPIIEIRQQAWHALYWKDAVITAGDFLVETVRDSGSRGLVNNTMDIQTRNGASILSGLTLRVVEIRGNCNDGIVASCAKIGLSSLLHFQQDHGRDFFRSLRRVRIINQYRV